MSHALVVVWLGTAEARVAHDADLDAWARSRWVELEEPSTPAPSGAAGHDDATASRIEALLAEATTAFHSGDATAAWRALDGAGLLVGDHLHLPEAAWLLGEIAAVRADVLAADDSARSEAERARALTLGGRRAAPFAAAAAGAVRAPAPSGRVEASPRDGPLRVEGPLRDDTVRVEGPARDDTVYVDGSRTPHPVLLGTGTHHLRVLRGRRLVWAGVVEATGTSVRVPVPSAEPCSEEDLARISSGSSLRPEARGVACPAWIAARPTATGISVARCWTSECGTFLPWNREWGATFQGPAQPRWPRPEKSTWITWAIAGAATATAAGLALWKTGAFETRGPPRESFEFTGPDAR